MECKFKFIKPDDNNIYIQLRFYRVEGQFEIQG
jgi:hypothetical protein